MKQRARGPRFRLRWEKTAATKGARDGLASDRTFPGRRLSDRRRGGRAPRERRTPGR